ncbi:MAG TPA: NAD(P)/FAD-dependent oxidoreductase [Streptosporangiales bacterium]
MTDVDILVVGAGPGGLAAASVAAEAGRRVLVVDESAVLGGQYLRPHPPRPVDTPLVRRFRLSGADIALGETVWHVDAAARRVSTTTVDVSFDRLVVATGAFDRPLAVPGARLGGVVTAGAAQALAKDGVRLGRQVLLVGSGPFLLPVARELLRTRAGIVELALDRLPWLGGAPLHAPGVVAEAAAYAAALTRGRVPVRPGWYLREVLGADTVTGAVLAGLPGGRHEGRVRQVACDVVAMGYGFLPQLAVADLAGCRMRFDAVQRTWFVDVRRGDMRTSVPGVYAVGEVTGIGGHRKAVADGLLAGHVVGGVPVPSSVRRIVSSRRRFAESARHALAPPPLAAAVAGEALVCRCETVTAGEIRAAAHDGGANVQGVRMRTRCGMGPCQARMCGQLCAELVAETAGTAVAAAGRLSCRVPARPTSLERMLA